MKSRMNKLMSLCLVAMMGTTFIPQPIQAEEVSEFEEEKQNVEASQESSVIADFEYEGLKYKITDKNKKEVEVIGFVNNYHPTGNRLNISQWAYSSYSLDETGVQYDTMYEVTSIGKSAFKDCQFTTIKGVTLPDSVITIGESAFAGCTALESINLPATLKTINESTFSGCTSLSYINFGYDRYESTIQLETIEDFAFKGCTSIYRVDLPDGLKKIGNYAFDLTDANGKNENPCLGVINIPSSVTNLGENFLGGVRPNGDTELFFQGTTLPTNMDQKALNGISGNNNQPTVYFPKAGINAYVAESSPFVKAGLIDAERFDTSIEQKYETIQICPGKWANYPSNVAFSPAITRTIISENPNIASVDENGLLTVYGITLGETFVSLLLQSNGEELVSEEPNRIKVKVEHNYVWQIEKWPTKDQPGSMFQYCLGCQDKKASVPIPPTGGGSGGGSTGGGSGGGSTVDPNAPTPQVENAVYRAYNSSNGEHLYTTNYEEFKVITKNGWDDEGIAFMSELKEKGQAVYRVYNPNNGLHHYTTDVNEKNALVSLGWNDEGVAFYTSKNPKDTPVYRVYNENDGNHHYTMNANEALALISMGWKNEGIAFFTTPMK